MMFDRLTGRQEAKDVQGARALGWASIGIGLTELLATKKVQDLLGLDDRPTHRGILRVLGVRELCHGIGLLSKTESNGQMTAAMWSRVAGDALDSALLGVAAAKTKNPASFGVVAAMVAGIGVADLLFAQRLTKDQLQ